MKNFSIIIVCFLFASSILKANSSKALEELTACEKTNAIIDIECKERDRGTADIIEETWNAGNYEEAIKLLKNSQNLDDAAIGIQWKKPMKTSLRWEGDVRVGNVDSILDIDFDIDNSNGNLIAALFYKDGSLYRYTINISLDMGETWSQTYILATILNYEIDIDGAVFHNYFYLAYTTLGNHRGNIRRFRTSDGSYDATYSYKTVIDEGPILKEISLASDADDPASQFLFYFSILDNDSLRLYFNEDDTLAASWVREANFNTYVPDADRGLDVCFTLPNKVWASYIRTDDVLSFIGGWSSWTVYPTSADVNGAYTTSIGAYGDSLMIVYADSNAAVETRYLVTSDGGGSWNAGVLFSSATANSFVNDVTARGGDGFGVVYTITGTGSEGCYRHTGYGTPAWTPPDSFADNAPMENLKPCIERLADGIYGILYVDQSEGMAWFDRSDWVSGVNENFTDKNTPVLLGASAAVFSDQVDINFYLPSSQKNMSLNIYDIAGNHVKTLAKEMPGGRNSVTWFADRDNGSKVSSGIYFAVLESGKHRESLKITFIR